MGTLIVKIVRFALVEKVLVANSNDVYIQCNANFVIRNVTINLTITVTINVI